MRTSWIAVLPLLSLALTSCGDRPGSTQVGPEPAAPIEDIAMARPSVTSVLFQNDYVRVLRFDLAPGEALPPHRGGRRVVYSLSDYELNWEADDESTGRRSWQAGDVHGHDTGVHSAQNSGETTASFLVFERLDGPLPVDAPDHTEGLPAGARRLFSGNDVEVLEVELAPGQAQQAHQGAWRVIYSLSDYSLEWRENGELSRPSWRSGDVHWHGPGEHAASNSGDTMARWLVVAFAN